MIDTTISRWLHRVIELHSSRPWTPVEARDCWAQIRGKKKKKKRATRENLDIKWAGNFFAGPNHVLAGGPKAPPCVTIRRAAG